jgi:hypothetical protein
MAIELKGYLIIAPCFRDEAGETAFSDIFEIPNHTNASMYFISDVGDINGGEQIELRLSLVVHEDNEDYVTESIRPGFWTIGKFDPDFIIQKIKFLISKCDQGSCAASLERLVHYFDYIEY